MANLVLCCMACNQAKGQLTGSEYETLLQTLQNLHPFASKNVLARLRAGARAIRSPS